MKTMGLDTKKRYSQEEIEEMVARSPYHKATANDVKSLIREVQTKVFDETGYNLECELIIL